MTKRPTKCKHCGRWHGSADLRGVITVLIVLFSFGLALIQLLKGGSVTLIAPWVAAILSSVVSMYFQARGGEVMRDKTNDIKDLVSKGDNRQ